MLRRYGLPEGTEYKADELARACQSDKKRDGGSITMIFPVEIGKCVLKKVRVEEIINVIKLGLGVD
jgi:3-dehydroquinate synthetase